MIIWKNIPNIALGFRPKPESILENWLYRLPKHDYLLRPVPPALLWISPKFNTYRVTFWPKFRRFALACSRLTTLIYRTNFNCTQLKFSSRSRLGRRADCSVFVEKKIHHSASCTKCVRYGIAFIIKKMNLNFLEYEL